MTNVFGRAGDFEPTRFIRRPSGSQSAFRGLDSEELSEAQSQWDRADQARIEYEAMRERASELLQTPDSSADSRARIASYRG